MGFFDFLKTKKQQPADDFSKLSKRDTLRAYSLDHPLRLKIYCLSLSEQKLCKDIFDFCFSPKAVLCDLDFDTTNLSLEEEKYNELKKKDAYLLINKFVKKFGDHCVYCYENAFAQRNHEPLDNESEQKLLEFIESYSKLKSVLGSKGQNYTDTELVSLLWLELRAQQCEQFEKKAAHGLASEEVQHYLDVFAELYERDVKLMSETANSSKSAKFFKEIQGEIKFSDGSFNTEMKEIEFEALPVRVDLSDLKGLLIGHQQMVDNNQGGLCPHTSTIDMQSWFDLIISFCNKVSILKKCVEAKGLIFETPNQNPIRISWLIETSLKKIKENELKKYEESLLNQDADLLQKIDSMDGYEFEKFLKELFARMGYEVTHTQLSGDQGADLVVIKHGQKTVVQAKRFSGSVGNGAVQEIVGAIKFYKADKGMVVTNSEYTASARKLALANNVELVNGAILSNWIDGNY